MRTLCFVLLPIFLLISNVFAQKVVINEFMASNSKTIMDVERDFPDWIELYNADSVSIYLENFGLSDDPSDPYKWIFPNISMESHSFLLIFASGKAGQPNLSYLHTNFKIKASGETLLLTHPSGTSVDVIAGKEMLPDVSYGRRPDGGQELLYFNIPTPGFPNYHIGFIGIAPKPEFAQKSGFHVFPPPLSFTNNSSELTIYYTLDGSVPTDSTGNLFSGHIYISETAVVRAVAYQENMLPSKVETNTYLIGENSTFPVVSLATNPENFWDEDYGIYVGDNVWEDWERPIHFELFETDGSLGIDIDAGVKIYGGWTRNFSQKSLAIFARGEYGASEINYQIFPNMLITQFQAFVLRNSGNDWNITQFRDAFMTSLVAETDLDIQAFRPAIVFINGEYWGIHNIREKLNEHYLASHHNVDPNNIDYLELNADVIHGDADHYQALLDFIRNNNVQQNENYDVVQTKMDVDNFIKYQVSQIYLNNTDWPGNNLKFWRPKTPDGRWRWILYDTDFGFGYRGSHDYDNNTLEFASAENGPDWPNPPWSTYLFRQLLKNETFQHDFINCFADFLNYYFKPDRVFKLIDYFEELYAPEIPRHYERWEVTDQDWQRNIRNMRDFARYRPDYMRTHIVNFFELPGSATVNLAMNEPDFGRIKVNSLELDDVTWSGKYFQQIPLKIITKSNPGYRFVEWQGNSFSKNDTLTIMLLDDIHLTAIFEKDTIQTTSTVVINEINYNSADNFDCEDWIELYNQGTKNVDMSGWIFKDSDNNHQFIFPAGTELLSREYVVLCRETNKFEFFFPEISNYLGHWDFGLAGSGELIRLYDATGFLIDSLTYDDKHPWPTEPDGTGATLALKDPSLDNAIAESWEASVGHGTPGQKNNFGSKIFTEAKLPSRFMLQQNYPNPFNPKTIIQFQLSKPAHVILTVYNIKGKLVFTLLDEYKESGEYAIEFDGSKYASGIYFYSLTAGEFADVKKMVFIR